MFAFVVLSGSDGRQDNQRLRHDVMQSWLSKHKMQLDENHDFFSSFIFQLALHFGPAAFYHRTFQSFNPTNRSARIFSQAVGGRGSFSPLANAINFSLRNTVYRNTKRIRQSCFVHAWCRSYTCCCFNGHCTIHRVTCERADHLAEMHHAMQTLLILSNKHQKKLWLLKRSLHEKFMLLPCRHFRNCETQTRHFITCVIFLMMFANKASCDLVCVFFAEYTHIQHT